MVQVFGTGLNIEALLGGVGEVVYNEVSGLLGSIMSALHTTVNRISDFIRMILYMIYDRLSRIYDMALDYFKKYISLMHEDPEKFTLMTANLIILFS